MNILVIGSGGREHTLAWKIAQSQHCDKLFIAPGNAGTAAVGENISLNPSDFELVRKFIHDAAIDMVVVGPEQPLAEGFTDALKDSGAMIIGPGKEGAMLESSKAFAKAFMQKYGIPTARSQTFSTGENREAESFIRSLQLPVVVKASGLAAGKGVLICDRHEEAIKGVAEMLSGDMFGESGREVVVEEFLDGIEFSVFVITDGKDYVLLPEAKDYKRIGEGDTGLNTGGMGAVSPVPFVDAELMNKVRKDVIEPTLAGIQAEEMDYCGFIFFGFMYTNGIPYLLEYNIRMGDPETEVVLPRLKSDLVELLEKAATGKLKDAKAETDARVCTTVMLVSGGYPGSYEKGKEIKVEELADADVMVFHAGTKAEDGKLLTNGGRVIAISALGADMDEALSRSYAGADRISFDGKFFRGDIGKDLKNK